MGYRHISRFSATVRLLLISALLAGACARGQSSDTAVADYVKAEMQRQHIPGLVAARHQGRQDRTR